MAKADEEWLDQIAGMIEEAPPESFVDSAALESWIEARMRRGEREGLKNSTDVNGRKHGEDDGRFEETGGGSGYTAAHRAKIGQKGDYKSLGLPPLRDIIPDDPIGKTKIVEAKARIAKGETITDPLGDRHEISPKTTRHWDAKHKSAEDKNKRYQSLDEAERTIEKPHEIWKNPEGNGQAFIRIVKSDGGRFVVNVAEMKNGTVSWHLNDTRYDYWRTGVLAYVR